MDEREEFCDTLGPHLADAMESLGIEDVDWQDGRALADVVFCLGYRLSENGSSPGQPTDDEGTSA